MGRVIEAALLQAAGYRYAPFALARYYLANIAEYSTLFNVCRKAAAKKVAAPNSDFVAFHLEGMRQTVNTLHDKANRLVSMLLYESSIRRALGDKQIDVRQYTILSQILGKVQPHSLDEIRPEPWYEGLYLKRNDKTRQRDMNRLREMELIFLDTENRLWPGFIRPGNVKHLRKKKA